MGKSLEVFINMLDLLQQSIPIDKMGLYVSSSRFFKNFSKRHPFIQDDRIELLKEWEVTGAGKIAKPDWKRIYRYEQEIGDPTLWSALIADRRIFFGKYFSVFSINLGNCAGSGNSIAAWIFCT